MKNILKISICLFLIYSCNNDDEGDDLVTDTETTEYLKFELSDDFVLDEKWYIYQVINETTNQDLLLNASDCEKDNFYVFDKGALDIIRVFDNENICDDFETNFSEGFYEYSLFTKNILIEFNSNTMLGGFQSNSDRISDVSFLIHKDSSHKLIRGIANIKHNATDIDVIYTLIAYPNDRP